MTDRYVLGETPTITAAFTVAGVPTDPTTLVLTVEKPDHTASVLGTWVATPGPIVRDSAGTFRAILSPDQVGLWKFRWVGSGAATGANEGEFYVDSRMTASIPGAAVYTYDLATAVGKVRFLIQDQDLSSVSLATPLEQRSAAFSDAEISLMLGQRNNDLVFTAAALLRVWASNKQLIVIRRNVGKGDVDYGAIRSDLLKAAEVYETQAVSQPYDETAEQSWDDFTFRRIIGNEYLRQLL